MDLTEPLLQFTETMFQKKFSASIGVYALIVDAKDEVAKSFYLKYGFIPLIDRPRSLLLSLATFP